MKAKWWPINFAWSAASYKLPKAFFRTALAESIHFSGHELFALVCSWTCLARRAYLEDCIWVQCERETVEGIQCLKPKGKECHEKITEKYFKGYGYKFHVYVPRDFDDIKKELKKKPRIVQVNSYDW